jgi:hypothetical protein
MEEVAEILIFPRKLVLFEIGFVGHDSTAEVFSERETWGLVDEEHGNEYRNKQCDNEKDYPESPFKLVPTRGGIGLEYLFIHKYACVKASKKSRKFTSKSDNLDRQAERFNTKYSIF